MARIYAADRRKQQAITARIALAAATPKAETGVAPTDASIYATRRRVNDLFLHGMLRSFAQHGDKALKEAAEQTPASYIKAFCLLMPRELKIEHSSPTSVLSDEQLTMMIQELEERVARRLAAGEGAKVIEGTAVESKRRKARKRRAARMLPGPTKDE